MQLTALFLINCVCLGDGLLLTYDAIYPAKHLVNIWHSWHADQFGRMGRGDHLWEDDPCDVPEHETLQYAYFRSLYPAAAKNSVFKNILHVAQHLSFYKSKLYPLIPRTAHYGFCHYRGHIKLVCDTKLKKCVSCSSVTSSSAVLHEACNLQTAIKDELPKMNDGATMYKSLKTWTSNIIGNWALTEGDSCNANGRQTLALTRMRKYFPSGMANGRDSSNKDEWLAEWKVIKDKFTSSTDLDSVKERLLGFGDNDAGYNVKYCAPSIGNDASYTLNGDDKLVCDGSHCVSCRNKPPPNHGTETYRFTEGPLLDACLELKVELRKFTTTTTTTTTTTERTTTIDWFTTTTDWFTTTTQRWG